MFLFQWYKKEIYKEMIDFIYQQIILALIVKTDLLSINFLNNQ